MDVSKNNSTPKIIHFNRVFHYFHHPFWDMIYTPIFGYFWKHHETSISSHHLVRDFSGNQLFGLNMKSCVCKSLLFKKNDGNLKEERELHMSTFGGVSKGFIYYGKDDFVILNRQVNSFCLSLTKKETPNPCPTNS